MDKHGIDVSVVRCISSPAFHSEQILNIESTVLPTRGSTSCLHHKHKAWPLSSTMTSSSTAPLHPSYRTLVSGVSTALAFFHLSQKLPLHLYSQRSSKYQACPISKESSWGLRALARVWTMKPWIRYGKLLRKLGWLCSYIHIMVLMGKLGAERTTGMYFPWR